ncbi:dCTP deaminase [Mangrovibacterium diazotrophicum]|uniref:dCTP deaminase n=1 Tax=Mangrovibacterium diazotrophicum TaxID=1261403 RepID=A0A419WAR0_9BACT|nr:dCTP deaminase [Mangrovibacterium diazotrophicum]RKD92529.1 dCTP deaminase [Mangrovibacterium diazotrophicum]
MYLTKAEIRALYEKGEFVIRPLLSNGQFGEVTVDLRLGTDFLVSIQGREPVIDATGNPDAKPIASFFQETKRLVGEEFYLHPHQTVLCSSLEYIKIPDDIFMVLSTRSSYNRLGLSLNTVVQPGYCGCLSLELTNSNNNPLKLLVGASIIQARLFKLTEGTNYFNSDRKYSCQVRPVASLASNDKDLSILRDLFLK